MNVFFRADASVNIGTGHVMRCMTLAAKLREKGASCHFISRNLTGNLCDFTESNDFPVIRLPAPLDEAGQNGGAPGESGLGVDTESDVEQTIAALAHAPGTDSCLVVDHYGIERTWETAVRPSVGTIMVIDDMGDRPHDCDLILDQNLHTDPEALYEGLVPSSCVTLFGPKYALLRPDFFAARADAAPRTGAIRRILVFFGGSDATNETARTLRALSALEPLDIVADVIIGHSNVHRSEIEALSRAKSWVRLHSWVDDISRLMSQADLSIGAGGSSTWERCSLGLPTVLIGIAENQIDIAQGVDDAGAGIFLGNSTEVTESDIASAFSALLADQGRVASMSRRAYSLVDALGADRVADALVKQQVRL